MAHRRIKLARTLIGRHLLHYEITARLGEGGMGVVYRAFDTKLGRDVAIKLLSRPGTGDAGERERLRIEARAAASLKHPSIATVYSIEESNEGVFIVMELVEGRELRDVIEEGALSIEQILDVAIQIAKGIEAAHQKGIVHRDIKPANIMITSDGAVKIMDFGLARVGTGTDLTRSGTTVGTVAYMSPEQVRAETLDHRTDIWSFGVVLYEMLTGERPFRGDYDQAVQYTILNVDPEPAAELSSDATGVDQVIARALQKNREARYQKMGDVIADLAVLTGDRSGNVPSTAASDARKSGSVPKTNLKRLADSATGALPLPEVRYCQTEDGVSIAYAVHGSGPVLVRVLGWFTHVEMEWEWPALRMMWEHLADNHTVVRYDGRGTGLSGAWTRDFTEDSRQLDLDAVIKAVGSERVVLYGISEGGWTAAHYAARYPERVSHLILYGSYLRGASRRPGFDPEEIEAMLTLMRKGWGRDTAEIRTMFTAKYFGADADPGLVAHFNAMQRAATDGDGAARYDGSLKRRGDATDVYAGLRVPTLVIHCRDDRIVPFEEGQRIAATVPGAKFLPLPTQTHYFPIDDEVTGRIVEAIRRFTAG